MKYLVFILLFALSQQLFAEEFIEIKFKFIDELTGKKLSNNQVSIVDNSLHTILDTLVHESFSYRFKSSRKTMYTLYVTNTGDYETNSLSFYANKKQEKELKIGLEHNEEYYKKLKIQLELLSQKEDSIYGFEKDIPEYKDTANFVEAEFKGGASQLQRFVNDNVRYPKKSIDYGESGVVRLSFVVEKDGTVTHVKIIQGAYTHLDLEAFRLVRLFPKYVPATYKGEKVRTINYIPIKFTVQ